MQRWNDKIKALDQKTGRLKDKAADSANAQKEKIRKDLQEYDKAVAFAFK